MKPIARHMQIYNSAYTYQCEICSNQVEVIPLASIGQLITVGLLVLTFWAVILFREGAQPGLVGPIIFATAGLALLFTIASHLSPHWRNKIVNDAETPNFADIKQDQIAIKSPIIWLENLGLLAGLIAPIVVIFLVLGLATLVGYVTYTFQ
ncbi:hypothetical protein [Pseudovibrio sp. Tun.PSC04-5.I4]|uniref:hypothetical protein n=1 Tax=Pseudovibrio sp. Tun.PSC04-5.I4 TaxID=1798213 RepID=UPI00117B6112|nr:hypothetical protein [Pseudovibrio sp. Tun.PSC04-5.I4]